MDTVDVIDDAVQTAQPANLVNILNGQLSTVKEVNNVRCQSSQHCQSSQPCPKPYAPRRWRPYLMPPKTPQGVLHQALIACSKTACIGRKLVLISKGMFMMGAPQSEKGRQVQETQPEVTNAFDDGCHINLLFD